MRAPRAACLTVVAALAVLAGGCDTLNDSKTVLFGTGSGLTAPLVGIGSAAKGAVSFAQFPNNVALNLTISDLPTGRYRVVIHANGLCNSPNGFSAGPPWSPPGVTPPLPEQIQPFVVSGDIPTQVSVRIRGVTLDGPNSLLGRSVVVHSGSQGSLEAVPNVRNDRVACGVIGPVGSLF